MSDKIDIDWLLNIWDHRRKEGIVSREEEEPIYSLSWSELSPLLAALRQQRAEIDELRANYNRLYESALAAINQELRATVAAQEATINEHRAGTCMLCNQLQRQDCAKERLELRAEVERQKTLVASRSGLLDAAEAEIEELRAQVERQQSIIETERATQIEWAEAFDQIASIAGEADE